MAEQKALLEPEDDEAPTIPPPTETPAESEPVREEAEQPVEPESRDYQKEYENVRQALREERQTKADFQKQLGGMQERLQGFESLKDELNTYRQSRQQTEQQDKFNDDPANYLKQKVDELDQKQQDLVNQSQHANAQALAQQQEMAAIRSQAQQYAQTNPDYENAFDFVQERRTKEFELYGVPQEHWGPTLESESVQLARIAMKQGKNPAEMLYQLAQQWGYQQPAAPATPKQGSNEENLHRLEQGQKAASTLSSGGQADESLLKSVERMSDDEFDKFWDTEVKPTYR